MSAPPYTPSKSITLKADTGATNHFISTNDLGYLQVKPPTEFYPSINALVPTGHTMTSKGHVHLPISHIPPSASLAHVMPKLASGSLMSVGKICDAGCTAIFDSTSVKIYQNKHVNIAAKNKPIIYGTRYSPTKPLYSIQLPTTTNTAITSTASSNTIPIHHINATIHNPTIRNRVAFYHKAFFSPTVAAWLNAHIKNFLSHGQPSQILKLLNTHHFPLPPSKAIATLTDQTSAQPKEKQVLSLSPTLPAQTILRKSFAPTTYSSTTSKLQGVPFQTKQDGSFAIQLVVTTTCL